MNKEIKIFDNLTEKNVIENNPLNLAFVGDAVWTMYVREYFLKHTNFKNNNLHKLTTKYVKATYQSKALDDIFDMLTENEKNIARRARNTKMNTVSKNASLADYKKATSFEAIIGYNYLLGNFEKLKEFFDKLSVNFLKEIK